ncbi:S41 family peptidase [uncultured Clostridium sp.]|uniref:S41 family peptidase n=1 Tax=uncultured Clostridium sp. TaxID=59620 RepID=UPI0025EC25B5|nr:S41 family peptidase [uncultured Clostridium sp.]
MKRAVRINILLIIICMILNIVGCGTQYLGGSRDEKWQKDLSYLQKALPKKHVDLFFNMSEDDFNGQIDELKNNVSKLNDEEVVAGIYKIVADVSDAHTKAYRNYEKRYPLQFYYFNNDIYLINTTEEYSEAMNCRLKKINGIDIYKVEELLTPLIAKENEWNIKKMLPSLLMRPDILKGVNISNNAEDSVFTFENFNNEEFDIKINSVDLSSEDNSVSWIVTDNGDETIPLYRQNSEMSYWYKYIEEKETLYFKYNSCTNDEDCGNIEDIIEQILEFIDENNVDKLVIDMRNNSGGSDGYLNPFIDGLKERNINTSNRLFVVIGRQTFSAAIIDACLLKEGTNAFFIGEPTSGKPNHYGQVSHFKLPNSRIDIAYSTKRCTLFSDEGDAFIPDKEIDISIDDYINKEDPIMNYILNN